MRVARQVRQLDLDGNIIREFDSPQEAARSLNKEKRYSANHITEACKGKRKTAFGYKWGYC